jgi:guanylate kinase
MAPGNSPNPSSSHPSTPHRHFPLSPPHLHFTQLTNAQVPTVTSPVIISGPSGVGKGTLYKLLLERHPSTFATSISHTTRDPRPGEQRDVDYYYVSMEEFEKKIEDGGFVEHAKFGGNRYGTSKAMIREFISKGRVVVLDIEMEVCFVFY